MREDGAKILAVLGHAGSAELTQANSMATAHTIESNGARRIGLGECAAGNGHPSFRVRPGQSRTHRLDAC